MASNPSTQSQSKSYKKPPKARFNSNKRSGSDKNVAGISNTLDDLLLDLECPVCQEHLSAPIFLCSVGHNLCGSCKLKLLVPMCPICKAELTDQRNLALEAICEKLAQPCINAKYGCKYAGSAEKMKAHTNTCGFKPDLCPIGVVQQQCTWAGRRTDLVQHFSQMHSNKMCVTPTSEITFSDLNVTKDDCDVQLISYQNILFLYHVKIDPVKGVANWAIQCIAGKQLANQWIYEFNFYNKSTCKQLKTVDQCSSHKIDVNSLYTTGDCVSVPLNVVKKFTMPSNNLTFKFFLKNKNFQANKPKPNMKPAPVNSNKLLDS